MIVILDYDMGNVGSIRNILNKVGQKRCPDQPGTGRDRKG